MYKPENLLTGQPATLAREFIFLLWISIIFPDNLNENLFYTITVNDKTPWTTISYNVYNTIELWWLIVLINKISNPVLPSSKTTLKILKPEYIRSVLSQINDQLK